MTIMREISLSNRKTIVQFVTYLDGFVEYEERNEEEK